MIAETDSESEGPYNVLCATHGGPVKALIPALAQSRGLWPPQRVAVKRVANCSITLIELDARSRGPGWDSFLAMYADASHLDEQDLSVGGDAEVFSRPVSEKSAIAG